MELAGSEAQLADVDMDVADRGLGEAAAVQIVGAEFRAAIAFLLLVGVLLVRPTGLFGVRD